MLYNKHATISLSIKHKTLLYLSYFIAIFLFLLIEYFLSLQTSFHPIFVIAIRVFVLTILFFLFNFFLWKKRYSHRPNQNWEYIYEKLFLSDILPITISELDTGKLVEVSDSFCKQLEYTRNELIGRIPDFLWADSSARTKTIEKLKKQGFLRNERLQYITKSGKVGYSLLSGELIMLNGKQHVLFILSEISNLVKHEESLEESKAILQGILDASLDEIALIDKEGKLIFSNNKLAQIWNKSKEELIVKSAAEILPFNIFESRLQKLGEALQNNKPMHFIDSYNNKWFENTISPIAEKGKLPEKAAIFSRDITDSMNAQMALKESEAELRAIFSSMKDVIIVLNKDGFYKKIAPTSHELLFKPPEQLLHKSLHQVFDKKKADEFLAAIKKALTSKQTITIDYFLAISGKPTWFACNITPIDNDNVLWVARDITERKIIFEKLSESEKRYQTLANISPVGIFRTTSSGYTTYVNPKWCEISGLQFSDALGNGWLEAVHPEDRIRIIQGWESATQVLSSSTAEYRFLRKDGSIRWVIGTACPEHDDNGNVIGYVGTITDITERKIAENNLRQSREEYKQLSSYLQKVREDERAYLAREMHDELGQLLTSVKLNLSLIKRLYLNQVNESSRASFESDFTSAFFNVDAAITSVRRIITELRPELLDKLGLIQALEWFIEEFEKNSKIKCSFKTEFEEFPLNKDTQLAIFRITQESLTNILKHSGATFVNVFLGTQNNSYILNISDNGVGFDINAKNNVQSYGLLGMKERAFFIGGSLEINSTVGEGTSVKLTIPK